MKLNKSLIIACILIITSTLIIFYSYFKYIEFENKQQTENQMDLYLKELADTVYKNKQLVLTSSVLLSKDENIKKCLKEKNEYRCIEYLKKAQKSLLNTSFFNDIKIHLHQEDLKSFFRLWDLQNKEHDSLASFRKSLNILKKDQTPIQGIEIGRFSMLIRGISPVMQKNEYLGSIETITNFDLIINHFKAKNIKLYILMDNKYKNIITKINFMKNQKLKNYLIINTIKEKTDFLENIKFKNTSYIERKLYYLLFTPILDIEQKEVGFYILKINKNR